MTNEPLHPILSLHRLPARVDAEAAAALLGFNEKDLPILCSKGILSPLGKPGKNSQKFYSSAELLDLARDRKWLDRATKAIGDTWAERNLKAKEAREKEQLAA